jgi:hypothetical protein
MYGKLTKNSSKWVLMAEWLISWEDFLHKSLIFIVLVIVLIKKHN